MVASRGTILCGVDASREARDALQVAAALSERLGTRLVVAYVGSARGGDRLVAEVADRAGVEGAFASRVETGDPATRLAEIAAEEGADLIVIGAHAPRLRTLRSRPALARELDSATSCPVLLAPRQTRRRSERRLARPVALKSG